MRTRHGRLGATVAAALITIAGCGSGGSARPEKVTTTEAKVTGKVTASGRAVTKGKVTFSPPGPPFVERTADIGQDGGYEISTFIGKNAVSVSGTGVAPKAGSYNMTHVEVKEGANVLDLSLPLEDK